MRDIARDLKASIEYGLAHRREALAHARGYSRGLDDSRTDRFVGMYVNAYTVDCGPTGRRAVNEEVEPAHPQLVHRPAAGQIRRAHDSTAVTKRTRTPSSA